MLVVGGTGYIGKFVVRELCAQGYDVTALVREKSGIGGKTSADDAKGLFPDATVAFGSVADPDSIRAATSGVKYDVVVSCLASRTGGIKDPGTSITKPRRTCWTCRENGPSTSCCSAPSACRNRS